MSPDEVIKKLENMEIKFSKRSLLNYEKWKLIPEGEQKSAGRGKGRPKDYPDETPYEAFAGYKMMHGYRRLRPDYLSRVREAAKRVERCEDDAYNLMDEEGEKYSPEKYLFLVDVTAWLYLKAIAEIGHNSNQFVVYVLDSKHKITKREIIHQQSDILNLDLAEEHKEELLRAFQKSAAGVYIITRD